MHKTKNFGDMNIIVPIKQVPDLVEELEVDSSGKALDKEWLKFRINEFDDHALEEALLLKEDLGGTVTVIALDGDDVDKALYTAAAKGADKLIKVTGVDAELDNHKAAMALASVIKDMDYDLILTGVQAVDDLDGQLPVLLAEYLGLPHIEVVTGVKVDGNVATVQKEFSGGIVGEYEVDLPAVLGIQAARETPRYVPVAKVRRAMRSAEIEEVSANVGDVSSALTVERMFKPETGGGAEFLTGSVDEIAAKIVELIKSKI